MKKGKQNIILLLCFTLSIQLHAQEIQPDSLWKKAKEQAANNDFVSAVLTLQILSKEYPYNNDYKLFLGRIFIWQNNFQLAVEILVPVAKADSLSLEAYEAVVTALLGAQDYPSVVAHCSWALDKIDGESLFFTLKKAYALIQLAQHKEAMVLLQKVLAKDPTNKEALGLRTAIFQTKINTLSVSYENSSFSQPGFAPRHTTYIEFKRSAPKFTGILRLNYIKMFGQQEPQFELDLYPKLSKTSYLYATVGLSEGTKVLPLLRGHIELYKTFNKVELSLGGRYMDFTDTKVKMITGRIGIAINTWDIGYRPLFSTVYKKWYSANSFSLRKTNEVKETLFQLDIFSGLQPYNFINISEFAKINAMGIGLHYQFRISSSSFLRPVISYEQEEYLPKQYRSRLNTQFILSKRFY